MLAFPFERIVPAHGPVLSVDAHAQAERALARMRTSGSDRRALPSTTIA
jgi:hypothetical protein